MQNVLKGMYNLNKTNYLYAGNDVNIWKKDVENLACIYHQAI